MKGQTKASSLYALCSSLLITHPVHMELNLMRLLPRHIHLPAGSGDSSYEIHGLHQSLALKPIYHLLHLLPSSHIAIASHQAPTTLIAFPTTMLT